MSAITPPSPSQTDQSDDDVSTVFITALGTSDAFNSGGRGNSSFFVQDTIGAYCLDCGPTTPLSAKRLGIDLNQIDVVYLTHLHGDHVNGLPSLLLDLLYKSNRQRPLTIAGPEGTKSHISKLCALSYPKTIPERLCFELKWAEWPLHSEVIIHQRRVSSRPAQHDESVHPTCIRIEPLAHGAAKVAFSGDTGWCESLLEVARGADALVCECSYASYLFDGHLSFDEIKNNRQKLEVNRLILTHFGQEARAAAQREHETVNVEVADDGDVFKICSRQDS